VALAGKKELVIAKFGIEREGCLAFESRIEGSSSFS